MLHAYLTDDLILTYNVIIEVINLGKYLFSGNIPNENKRIRQCY